MGVIEQLYLIHYKLSCLKYSRMCNISYNSKDLDCVYFGNFDTTTLASVRMRKISSIFHHVRFFASSIASSGWRKGMRSL